MTVGESLSLEIVVCSNQKMAASANWRTKCLEPLHGALGMLHARGLRLEKIMGFSSVRERSRTFGKENKKMVQPNQTNL